MKTLIVFCALASVSACAHAAGLFDNATAVSTVSESQTPPAAIAKPEAPKAPSGVVQGSVQYSMGGKTVTPGNLPAQTKMVTLPDGRVVPVLLRPNVNAPEAEVHAPAPAVAPEPPAAIPAAVAKGPAPVAPAPAPVPAESPVAPGSAVFVMPDGRVVRVDAPGKPAIATPANADDKSLEWTLELPGEAPIRVTPEMVSAGRVTLPDGRVIKLVSAAELAAKAKAEEAKRGLFSQAVPVESRLAQGGENRAIAVTYVTGQQTVSLSEKVDAAVSVPAKKNP